MYTISVEQIIGSYAVKYVTLKDLINTNYAGSRDESINIFIDLGRIYQTLSGIPLDNVDPIVITSSVINLCAHYRAFFDNYYGVSTKIFLIISDMSNVVSINKQYVPSYKKSMYGNNEAVNNAINQSVKYLELLVPYIDDIGLYQSYWEFGVIMYDILSYEHTTARNQSPSLIISKDPYNLQLVSDPGSIMRVDILRCKKDAGEDRSYIVNHTNVMKEICHVRNVAMKGQELNLNPSLISLIYALSRVPERDIPTLHQLPSVLKAISKAISDGVLMNDRTVDIEYVCDILSKRKLLNVKDPMQVQMRFKAIDIECQCIAYYSAEPRKYNGIENLYDPEGFKQISMKYFKDHPLDVNSL